MSVRDLSIGGDFRWLIGMVREDVRAGIEAYALSRAGQGAEVGSAAYWRIALVEAQLALEAMGGKR